MSTCVNTPIRARSLVFGPRRPNGEYGTFGWHVATFSPRDVQFLIELYGSESATAPGCRRRARNVCLTAYWRAVADTQNCT